MPDKMKLEPCPWCGHSAEMEGQGYQHEALVFCPKCSRGVTGECGDIDDAIAAWNALPRGPVWTEYNGKEQTLPQPETAVIISTNGVVQRACVQRYDEYWDFGEDVDPLKISVGDRWIKWPGEE